MAAHVYHEWPDGTERPVLYDDCPECDARATQPWDLDASSFEEAWRLMVNFEHRNVIEGRAVCLTWNERRLVRELYRIAVLMERHMRIDPWRWPPTIAGDRARLDELLDRDAS